MYATVRPAAVLPMLMLQSLQPLSQSDAAFLFSVIANKYRETISYHTSIVISECVYSSACVYSLDTIVDLLQ